MCDVLEFFLYLKIDKIGYYYYWIKFIKIDPFDKIRLVKAPIINVAITNLI